MANSLPSLGSRLDSSRAKLRRAKQQIGAFKHSFKIFADGDRYQNGVKAYDPGLAFIRPTREVLVPERTITTALGIQYVEPAYTRLFFNSAAFTLTLREKSDFSAQFLRWGVLVGEIVHNIGSALDNLIWELAQPLPPPPPATASSRVRSKDKGFRKQIGFPYTKERKDWGGNCSRYLYFVTDPAVRTVLEEAQAFYAWEQTRQDPNTFPLELVHELWNGDKHRTVSVTTAGLQFQVPNIQLPRLFPGTGNLPFQVIKVFPIRPLQTETEMAAVMVEFPNEIEFPQGGQLAMDVIVNPKYTLGILFGEGSSAEGSNALDMLRAAHKLAAQVVNQFL